MCYAHHVETNDVVAYSVARLKEMKARHEEANHISTFEVSEADLRRLSAEMDEYWRDIEWLNTEDHQHKEVELSMEVDGSRPFSEVQKSAEETLGAIERMLDQFRKSDESLFDELKTFLKTKDVDLAAFGSEPYCENPFIHRNWEAHNLGVRNWMLRLRIDLAHIQVLYWSEYATSRSAGTDVRAKLENAKQLLAHYAQSAMHVD
jgi:hypothetical protein